MEKLDWRTTSRVIKLAIKPVTENAGGQQQSNQTSNQTSNQSAGGGQQQQQGNQSGSGLAQNETGGNETSHSMLEQTEEPISKTFAAESCKVTFYLYTSVKIT